MKTSISYFVLLVVLFTSCSRYENFAGYEGETESTTEKINLVSSDKHSTIEAELFDLINNYRLSIGLNTLEFENVTYYYAGLHTDYMIEKETLSHAKFAERAENISKRTGAEFVAENVASKYDSVEEALEAWLNSPGHRQNIEGDYTHSAISIKTNHNGDLYFTQLFFR